MQVKHAIDSPVSLVHIQVHAFVQKSIIVALTLSRTFQNKNVRQFISL